MRNLILASALMLCMCFAVNAQDISFGAKAGVNFASIGGDDTEDVDSRTGFHVGVLAEFMLTEQFGIQPELLYSMQGAKGEYSESGIRLKEELKLDYLNLPILAKYKVTPGFSLHLGPQVGFLLSAEDEIEFSMDGETVTETEDIKDFVSSVDFGLTGGLGYELDMGVFFNARYYLGLSNINEEGDSDYSQQNNVIQLSVGYMF